jgi:hypothetical protein
MIKFSDDKKDNKPLLITQDQTPYYLYIRPFISKAIDCIKLIFI